MAETIVLKVAESDGGGRLDSYVSAAVGRSRSLVQRWIEGGRVRVDGRLRKASFAVEPGQRVEVEPAAPEPLELQPEALPLEILFEDEDLLVINKPSGLVVHPGAGNRRGTLANALLHHLQQVSRRDTLRPGIVHRLDKGTSGVLIVARNEPAHEALAAQFELRQVEKVYLALVYGRTPPRGEIDLAIGRDFRSRIRISPRTRRPRAAVTRFETIRQWEAVSLVRIYPLTGRTHQIRVHFLHLGYPVVGDDLYIRRDSSRSPELVQRVKKLGRLFLHATSIRFVHPSRQETMGFEVPLPPELEDFLSSLGEGRSF